MRRGNIVHALLMAGLACMFAWYLVDLTMLSVGLSSRETRNFATSITVFVTGAILLIFKREVRMNRMEKSRRVATSKTQEHH
jgi:uncharacterized membrane protein YqjE